MSEARKLKRVVIKEEYLAITGDFQKAVILNQFIYWSERIQDFDDFIIQENIRATQSESESEQQELTDGWIYKTAEELSEETMLGLSASNIRKHLKVLIDIGFISERTSPKHKWDKTKQYRINLINIINALSEKGYTLSDYKTENQNPENAEKTSISETENRISKTENRTEQNEKAIPEITNNNIYIIKEKIKKEKKTSYDEILETVDDTALRNLYLDYIEMRKMIKSPMTDRALKMLINRCEKIAPNNTALQKQMLETAIINNWKNVYRLKNIDYEQDTPLPQLTGYEDITAEFTLNTNESEDGSG